VKKRLGTVVLVVALGVTGALAAYALADSPPPPTTTESTTTPTDTSAQSTPSAPVPTTVPTPPKRPSKRTRIASGVTIAGIHVGGLAYGPAYSVLSAAFRSPLVLEVGDQDLTVSPFRFDAKPNIGPAVRRALLARPGSKVRMVVSVHRARVEDYVRSLAARYDRDVVDAHVVLRHLRPQVVPEKEGRTVLQAGAVKAIVEALQSNDRGLVAVPASIDEPKIFATSFGPMIVIRRESKWLYLYRNVVPGKPAAFVRRFQVATGQAVYPTPLGSFSIIDMQRDPWWYPPDSAWAKGEHPIPPGPGNPLGTRWMGLSAPGVGIHGTPDPASLGYSASHGCIRMYIPSAEWLFNHVQIGTPVLIVPA
jgi:lipoprotein-anchoring transpeptidase ErfK/SrfK